MPFKFVTPLDAPHIPELFHGRGFDPRPVFDGEKPGR